MKRFAMGLIAATCALALTGCGDGSGSQADNSGGQAEESAAPADAESKEASERASLSPDDYSSRVLSLDDVPEGFSLEDEVEFGEKDQQAENPFDSADSSPESASSQSECVAAAMSAHSSDLDGVSTARSFEQSAETAGQYIMTSLTRPEGGSEQLYKGLRKTVDDCQQTIDAQPTESVEVFEPSGNKGDAFCTSAYNGSFSGQGKFVMAECYVSWAGELLTIHQMAFEAETSLEVEQEAMDGVTGYVTDDLLPTALKKAEMAIDRG